MLFDNGQTDEGRAFVYHGAAAGLATRGLDGGGDQVRRLRLSVATAGDVNGDGYSDVIVGASRYDNGEAMKGGRSSTTVRRGVLQPRQLDRREGPSGA